MSEIKLRLYADIADKYATKVYPQYRLQVWREFSFEEMMRRGLPEWQAAKGDGEWVDVPKVESENMVIRDLTEVLD